MWTPTTREQYSRTALRYETDLTDAEWAVIEPHMPRPAKLGRPPDWTFREIINAIFYILRGGIPWRWSCADSSSASASINFVIDPEGAEAVLRAAAVVIYASGPWYGVSA